MESRYRSPKMFTVLNHTLPLLLLLLLLPQVVYELPATSQWIFEVHWCPRNPAIISTASFDGHVTLYSLLGGGGSGDAGEAKEQVCVCGGDVCVCVCACVCVYNVDICIKTFRFFYTL